MENETQKSARSMNRKSRKERKMSRSRQPLLFEGNTGGKSDEHDQEAPTQMIEQNKEQMNVVQSKLKQFVMNS